MPAEDHVISLAFTGFSIYTMWYEGQQMAMDGQLMDRCFDEYILIKNGKSGDDAMPIVARECGTTKPTDILLQDNLVSIAFQSGLFQQGVKFPGFKMYYHVMKGGFKIIYIDTFFNNGTPKTITSLT